MPFVEDPACLSKSRLKSDLVAHNVELPPAGSKKEAYVALHLRHVDQTNAADFSSDDDQEHNVAVSLSIYSFFFFSPKWHDAKNGKQTNKRVTFSSLAPHSNLEMTVTPK